MENLTTAQPKQFLKDDGKGFRGFQTRGEVLFGDILPQAGHYASLFVKTAMLAPLTGGLSLTLPVVAALTAAATKLFTRYADRRFEKEADDIANYAYDFSNRDEISNFKYHYSKIQPYFVEDYLQLCRDAGFENPPPVAFNNDRKVYAAAKPLNSRDKGMVEFSDIMFSRLNREEFRAIIAHELIHLKLRHGNKSIAQSVTSGASAVLGGAVLLGAAFFSLPFLPMAGALIGLHYFDKMCTALQSRAHEKICDRGAALLTGGTAALASALQKIGLLYKEFPQARKRTFTERTIHKIFRADVRVPTLRDLTVKTIKLVLPQHMAVPVLKARFKFMRFVKARHPSDHIREELLMRFENKYPVFCESKRGAFSDAFNRVATRPAIYENKYFSANRLKSNNNI